MIPARLGSKRIEKKNIRLLNGAPLINYIIEAAKDAGCFDEIYINSEADISELSYECEYFHTVEVMCMILFYDLIHQTDNKCPSIKGEKVRLQGSSLRGGDSE